MTTERPMLFSAPMIRALLAGTKSQTRRVVKDTGLYAIDAAIHGPETAARELQALASRCPYGQPGDRLWVREAFRFLAVHDHVPPRELSSGPVWFGADVGMPALRGLSQQGKLRPGMFMPRWASRLSLEVVSVRVERLQDISEADVRAEGCRGPEDDIDSNLPNCPQCGGGGLYTAFNPATGGALPDTDCRMCDTSAKRYRLLWDQINGAGAWEQSPWVWVVEFRRVTA